MSESTLEISDDGTLKLNGNKVTTELDDYYKSSPVGSINRAISDTFYGINHRQMPNQLPINKDQFGMVFFTRPLMNMTSANLSRVRQMIPLLTTNEESILRIIRVLFDKNLQGTEGVKCALIDNQQAFIPFLTGTIEDISGWPDLEAPMYNSPEGHYKESYSYVDGISQNYTTFNLQGSFRNIYGDPVTLFFFYWIHYMSYVFQGLLDPYPNFILENEADYMTRIYRLVLDANRNKVVKISAIGAGFPYAVSIGAAFNYSTETTGRPFNASNDRISIPFKCMGAMYLDDILVYEFNRAVQYFNKNMDDNNRKNLYVKIPTEYLILFNHQGYPRIDYNTYELEWWIDKETYQKVISNLSYKPNSTYISLDSTKG